MAVSADIKFEQGPNTDSAGVAVIGTLTDGAVTITNGDNTGVYSWDIELLYRAPNSILSLGQFAAAIDNLPTGSFGIPDFSGCYRVQLRVRDLNGIEDVDIRNFAIPNARGIIVPPYQKNPDPIDLSLKDDELNFAGQAFGWLGDRNTGLHETFFYTYDDLIPLIVGTTPFTAEAVDEEPLYIVNLATITGDGVFNLPTADWRVGQSFRVQVVGETSYNLTVNMPGGHTVAGQSAVVLFDGYGERFVYIGSSTWVMLSRVSRDSSSRFLINQVFS